MWLAIAMSVGCVPQGSGQVLSGWEFEWQDLSHRVSELAVASDSLTLVGGNWSTGEQGADLWQGEVQRLTLDSPVDIVTVELEAGSSLSVTSPWGDRPQVALIQGFGFSTGVEQGADYPSDYDPAHGYTVGRLGVEISEVVDGEVTVGTTFLPRPTGESFDDRPEMDAAMDFAVVGSWVSVAFVPLRRVPEELPVEVSGTLPYSPPYSDHDPTPLDLGTGAWRRFDIDVNRDTEHGDYLRALGLSPEQAWVSGSSVFELQAMKFAVSGDFVPLEGQIEERSRAWSEPGVGSL